MRRALILLLLVPLVPVAGANHGLYAVGDATAGDESWTVYLEYRFETQSGQLWALTAIRDGDASILQCQLLGSIEDGFREAATCVHRIRIGGTGVYKPYPSYELEQARVTFDLKGRVGTMDLTILPDTL